ncbi:hypothetical protein [Limisalsivibrio acetivorans]|uniref:hypothetical protein n=1 Tax=Limisalsivibrio acetivorans TaxID=1304888 RepID=UPI0003B68771|nr:hypothetical protein [Limisalsivibrio acetivorans]
MRKSLVSVVSVAVLFVAVSAFAWGGPRSGGCGNCPGYGVQNQGYNAPCGGPGYGGQRGPGMRGPGMKGPGMKGQRGPGMRGGGWGQAPQAEQITPEKAEEKISSYASENLKGFDVGEIQTLQVPRGNMYFAEAKDVDGNVISIRMNPRGNIMAGIFPNEPGSRWKNAPKNQ